MGLEKGQKLGFEINGISTRISEEVRLLGITTDSKLQCQSHVEAICKTANQKVKAFSRIAGYLQKHKTYAHSGPSIRCARLLANTQDGPTRPTHPIGRARKSIN